MTGAIWWITPMSNPFSFPTRLPLGHLVTRQNCSAGSQKRLWFGSGRSHSVPSTKNECTTIHHLGFGLVCFLFYFEVRCFGSYVCLTATSLWSSLFFMCSSCVCHVSSFVFICHGLDLIIFYIFFILKSPLISDHLICEFFRYCDCLLRP